MRASKNSNRDNGDVVSTETMAFYSLPFRIVNDDIHNDNINNHIVMNPSSSRHTFIISNIGTNVS